MLCQVVLTFLYAICDSLVLLLSLFNSSINAFIISFSFTKSDIIFNTVVQLGLFLLNLRYIHLIPYCDKLDTYNIDGNHHYFSFCFTHNSTRPAFGHFSIPVKSFH